MDAVRTTIKVAIAERGLSQRALARRADVHPSQLSEFLRGSRGDVLRLGLGSLDRIAGELGFEIALMGAREPKQRRKK